ncbi:TPA: site-specific integrase [Staphylococcus pseudintermedius]|uniref:tyrosine-type recombinase/integrase n=1 Tax=Staphylococcus pseudintermedius TaxID=283734 RepID=UPI0011244686|nr:site-specific integrase [Staphylococcus pseudintermedius]EGQ0370317.1 site-specific integrase [Staphylococcus pseudintermedius]EGQ0381026.1 site-specific integrase [Staphylococcus pseudintermedius]EGQ1288499.1 tyrosine-type recombinase/integrase [Staphylococcus pseudintermedius]EGQ1628194.1 site-specific integrase [Staphylococcus pseudintermedius]EGQ1764491.1 site-specific integrase [Staphylococcus pseudintermedius]
MYCVPFIDKHGKQRYRFYESYKDPLTEKKKYVSVVMNKDTKPSQREAQKLLDEKVKQKITDKTPQSLKTLTFHQACDEWFENYKTVSGSKQSTISTKFYKIKHIKRNIDKDILVKNMNTEIVQDLINSASKANLSHKVIKDAMSIIRNIMKHTQKKYKLADISYLDDVVIPKQAKTRDEVKAKRENYLEMSEIQLIIDKLNEMATLKPASYMKLSFIMTAYIVEFMALNGMRVGECLAIQPNNIDFDKKTLEIDGTIHWIDDGTGHGVKDTTKTEASYRTISLTTRSCDILRKVMLENKKALQWERMYKDRGFIFTNHYGNPMALSSINRNIQMAVGLIKDKDGKQIIKKHVTTHTLRHSHVSLLSQLGVSLKAIMERVGHTDHKTTLQIYSHVTEQMDKDMMSKLEAVRR